ncbi:MAG: sulfite exporter TauE/SafE family protein [Rhodobacteraceae bacterium]|nr:sulfite exporter TauE/SafE family protein [Paracoccaceae bacterium]
MDMIWLLLLMLGIGAFAGVAAGLLGVGGGIILVPAYYYAFETMGYQSDSLMQIAVATSLATIVVTSVRSVLSHHKKGAVEWEILRRWAPGIGIGAALGVVLASGLESRSMMLVFGFLGVSIGLYMALGRVEWRLGSVMPTGLARAIVAPVIGFLSVLMGIGGGSFGVPLMALYGRKIHNAVATAAGFGVIIAVPSTIGFLLVGWGDMGAPPFTVGRVNLAAFAITVSMTMLTAPLGVKLAHMMDPKPLKRVFAAFIIIMALNMLRKALLA